MNYEDIKIKEKADKYAESESNEITNELDDIYNEEPNPFGYQQKLISYSLSKAYIEGYNSAIKELKKEEK